MKKIIKRIFDFSFSLLLIFLGFIPILLMSFIIKLKIGSPIFFIQKRPGLNNKIFKFFKFRTMKPLSKNNKLITDKERLTNFGIFLRETSLDELPSLFNVLIGDMSFVGPRPLLVQYLELYNKNQMRRHSVKPGITGLAQISGRNNISWKDKINYDLYYVDNWSLILDFKILFKTFFKVLRRENINKDGYTTSPPFKGNN